MKKRNIFTNINLILTLFLSLASCSQNHHITGRSESQATPPVVPSPVALVDLAVGLSVADGGETVALPANMGTCYPDGVNVFVSSPQMTPVTATCTCDLGVIDCSSASESPFTFTSVDALLSAEIEDPSGVLVSDSDSSNDPIVAVKPIISIVPISTGALSAGSSVPVQGTCSSEGSAITITNPDPVNFSPASLTCPCGADGTFNCGSFTVNPGVHPEATVTFTGSIIDADGDSEALATDLLMGCTTEELNNTGGTLTYGTNYTVSLSAGAYTDVSGGDWIWGRGGRSDIVTVDFLGESAVVHIKPQQVLTLNTQVWNNAVSSGFTVPSSFCPAVGYTDLTFIAGSSHPEPNPGAIVSGDCIRGYITSSTTVPKATQDWGEARASNVSSFTMSSQSFDGYNFSVTTCGVL